MSYDEGTFIEPLGLRGPGPTGSRRLQPGQTVLVLGSGISGLLHIMLARRPGPSRIIATDISDFSSRPRWRLGADRVISAHDDVPAKVQEANEGRGADLVIVCTGAMSAFPTPWHRSTGPVSILCFATTEPGTDLQVPINEFWRNSVTILSSYAAAPMDLVEAIEVIRDRKVDVTRLITHRFPLDDAAMGFQMMASGQASVKILVYPQQTK